MNFDIQLSSSGVGPGSLDQTLAVKKSEKTPVGVKNRKTPVGTNTVPYRKSASWTPQKWVKSNAWRRRKTEERVKVSVNNGQLRLRTPPWMAHANCLDQQYKIKTN